MKKTSVFAAAAALLIMMGSCAAPKTIPYFTDLNPGMELPVVNATPIKLQPNDKVSIIVSTSDARLNALFNLPVSRVSIGTAGSSSSGTGSSSLTSSGGESTAPYTVDSQGDIDFPVLGKLHVAGMTREGLAEYIRRELISRDLAKNPIVTVEYLNLCVTVLGEVGHPGRFAIDREDYNILDALSAAGDLVITGKRENIKVIRGENGVQRIYGVNLNDGKALVNSPVYYLKQNDVIYVEPNATKARLATPNGNSSLTPSFWISIASFVSSMAVLVINLTK